MAGIAPRTLSDYTAGRREIAPHHIIALTRSLKVEPEDVLEPAQLAKLKAGKQQAKDRADAARQSAVS